MASAALDMGETIALSAGFLPHPSERLPDPSLAHSLGGSGGSIHTTPMQQHPSKRMGLGGAFGYPCATGEHATISPMGYHDFKTNDPFLSLLDEKCGDNSSASYLDPDLWNPHGATAERR